MLFGQLRIVVLLIYLSFSRATSGDFSKAALMSTSTAYETSQKYHRTLQDPLSRVTYPSFCEPIALNFVFRHGSRYPVQKHIQNLQDLYDRLRTSTVLSDELKEKLHRQRPFDDTQAGKLTRTGISELRKLGERFAKKFNFTSEIVRCVSSHKDRCVQSRDTFIEAFAFSNVLTQWSDKIVKLIDDDTLRFFEKCDRFKRDVEDCKCSVKEYNEFLVSQYVEDVRQKVSERVGIDLTTKELSEFHHLCKYEISANNTDEWCQFFDNDDLLTLEYLVDLKVFTQNSSSNFLNPDNSNIGRKSQPFRITRMSSCPLLRSMLDSLDKVVRADSNNLVRMTYQFGHAETLLPLMSLIGLHTEPEPLRADNFEAMRDQRNFRTSRNVPFAANLGFVLYKCNINRWRQIESWWKASRDSKPNIGYSKAQVNRDMSLIMPTEFEPYMVQMLHNENVEYFPFCPYDLCGWSKVINHYADAMDECEFDELCGNEVPAEKKDDVLHTEL